MLLPSHGTALRCFKFIKSNNTADSTSDVRVIDLVVDPGRANPETVKGLFPTISAVIFPKNTFSVAKQYWQHTGDGISSRRAEFCHNLFRQGALVDEAIRDGVSKSPTTSKGPRRYQRGSVDTIPHVSKNTQESPVNAMDSEIQETAQFLEERFGRNLDISFIEPAKSAIRKRIAGSLTGDEDQAKMPSPRSSENMRGVTGLDENDVLLYPCGMNAIFQTHQMMLEARGPLKSISFGFPYIDTLKILEKFGPGCIFYGNGSSDDLDDLERRLETGERYLALFCEFPGNPLLHSPNLQRIRQLADTYDFAVVVDETISNLVNVHVLPLADVVVSSLTKIFSGGCNVMGGSAILNPRRKYYQALKDVVARDYEDNYWAEDVIFMERNSRHFIPRIEKINKNSEVICDVLKSHALVKTLYYPKYNASRENYDACRTANGGYGGLLSVAFHTTAQAIAFYDTLETAKGPSLGTNFTLASPYVILAHYLELDWAAQYGVPADLIRISVGLEDEQDLRKKFEVALRAAEEAESQ